LIEGIVELPAGFEPKTVHSELATRARGKKKILQTFDWIAVSN